MRRAPAWLLARSGSGGSGSSVRVRRSSRFAVALVTMLAVALAGASAAWAHARLSPAVSLSGELQLYSLTVPTEKEGAATTQVVLTVPKGFSIDSFVPAPGWRRVEQSRGAGADTVIQKVTWKGGRVPAGEDALFQFLGEASGPGAYAFQVEQTYSDGSVVDWSGPESAEDPAPSIEARASLGGGGGGMSTATIVALVLGALGVVLGGAALLVRGGRELA